MGAVPDEAPDNGRLKLQYPDHLLAITKLCKQIREESLEYLPRFYSGMSHGHQMSSFSANTP